MTVFIYKLRSQSTSIFISESEYFSFSVFFSVLFFQFENCFSQKPGMYMTFWSANESPEKLLEVSGFSANFINIKYHRSITKGVETEERM